MAEYLGGAHAQNARARRLLAGQLALAAWAIDWRRGLGGTALGRPEQRRRDLPRGLDALVRSARRRRISAALRGRGRPPWQQSTVLGPADMYARAARGRTLAAGLARPRSIRSDG